MTLVGIALRFVHLLPGLLLIGTFTALLAAGPCRRPTAARWEATLLRGVRVLALWVLVSGVAVLAHQAAFVSGRSAIAVADWLRVLSSTQFGTVWLVRHGILLLLAALLFLRERETGAADWTAFRGEAWLLGAAGVGALAWAGHAAAVETWGLAAALADALHLVAAGAWLGALLPLALLLRATAREDGADGRPFAVLALRRFSGLALGAMLCLVLTGLWSAWNQIATVPALVGTPYGRLLLLKLALLVPILALAAVNRRALLPVIGGEAATVGRPAMLRLARHVAAEWLLGAAIIAVVAALGSTPPGRHDTPWWPWSFRLDYAVAAGLPGVKTRLFIGAQVAILGLLVAAVGALLRRWRAPLVAGGAAALVIGGWVALPPLAVDAYPTTYRRPTVPYNAISVAAGLDLYGRHCVACHGAAGRGDGPAGAGLPKRPADLTAPHTGDHTAGDLYWWLTHGIPRSGMPPFGQQLSEDDRWDLINYLRALSAAEQGRGMAPVVEPNRPWLVAPDFSYSVGPGPGRSLKDFRNRQPVLLVFFSLPASRSRLELLARAYDTLRGFGVEVLGISLDGDDRILARLAGGGQPVLFPVVTEGSEEIARAYRLFFRTYGAQGAAGAPTHAEFLVDRGGYVRARWIPGPDGGGWADPARIIGQLQQLAREAPAPPPAEHVH